MTIVLRLKDVKVFKRIVTKLVKKTRKVELDKMYDTLTLEV